MPQAITNTGYGESGRPAAPNRLERNFSPAHPNAVWSGDITYIATEEGWLFLAVVIDLFSLRVVGWRQPPNIRRSLVIDWARHF